ncbi:MAG: N-acetylneuraminate synthase [bacterium]|nr:N-acetylneuraminate synthase [bacterium]
MSLDNCGRSTFIIAEAGVNHNGRIELARKLIDAAADAGADAVKFQTWVTEEVVVPGAPLAPYQAAGNDTADQFSLLKKLELSKTAFNELKTYSETRGLEFLSTPDEEKSADFLDSIGVSAFKIGSGELTNLPLLRHVAAKGKTIVLSTGMGTLLEVEEAVRAIEDAYPETGDQPPLILLHAVTAYPAPAEEYNLRALVTLRENFGYPVGLSDHTQGYEIALAAVALEAGVIEKHLTLDQTMNGPDHAASINPAGFKELVEKVRLVEKALGDGVKRPAACEMENLIIVRKSLVARVAIPAGTVIREEMLSALRPGTGISPSRRKTVIGKRARQNIPAGTQLTSSHLAEG